MSQCEWTGDGEGLVIAGTASALALSRQKGNMVGETIIAVLCSAPTLKADAIT